MTATHRMPAFSHGYAFDPAYGYTWERLLAVPAPEEPEDFARFWQARHARALALDPEPVVTAPRAALPDFVLHDLQYLSTDGIRIGGWLLTPRHGAPRRLVVAGHGYGGREAPDPEPPGHGTAWLFPCLRGLSRSRLPGVSELPAYHVLHDLQDPHRYLLGGCVEDLWLAVSAALALFPDLARHIGFSGISFSGGIGALALAFDPRVRKAYLEVPSFGNQPLRLALPTTGAGAAIAEYARTHGDVMNTLQYFDAAVAARHITIPILFAGALFDPCVAPPGQFAIFNALAGPKELLVADAGHFEYPAMARQARERRARLEDFFEDL